MLNTHLGSIFAVVANVLARNTDQFLIDVQSNDTSRPKFSRDKNRYNADITANVERRFAAKPSVAEQIETRIARKLGVESRTIVLIIVAVAELGAARFRRARL